MAANPYLELVNRRGEQVEVQVLFVGVSLAGAGKVFKRDRDPVKCQHVQSSEQALEVIGKGADAARFDCIMVDMRNETDGSPLNVVAIAALRAANRLVVLSNPDQVDAFEEIVGVDVVLPAPVDPKAIIATIVESALVETDELVQEKVPASDAGVRTKDDDDTESLAAIVPPDVAPVEPQTKRPATDEVNTKSAVTTGFETSLSRASEADRQVWQRFVPLANFVYKKLAIVILSALFLAFVSYGLMIVFFMASSSWSMPFELSRGHTLVEKVERDLSLLRLRRNELRQNVTSVQQDVRDAERQRADADLQVSFRNETIKAELRQQFALGKEIKIHIGRLETVLDDFSRSNTGRAYTKNLRAAFSKRLITKKTFDSGSLALIETLHRIATVESELATKRLELKKTQSNIAFLQTLLKEIHDPEILVVASSGSELSHLANDLIQLKNRIADGNRTLEANSKRLAQLYDSRDAISKNLTSLELTPAARALKAPVMVLFVPYTNSDNVVAGEPLYSCALSIFWCSQVGQVGAPIGGETTTVHPLFGKPLRGTFVEAEFDDPKSVTEEMVHANGAPFLF